MISCSSSEMRKDNLLLFLSRNLKYIIQNNQIFNNLMSAHPPRKTLLHFIFLGIVIGEIIGVVWLPSFELVFKPLIMIWVGIYFYLKRVWNLQRF